MDSSQWKITRVKKASFGFTGMVNPDLTLEECIEFIKKEMETTGRIQTQKIKILHHSYMIGVIN